MGVVFFPSLPFMGVMLFPSSWLGNASREWGLVRPSPPTPHSLSFFSLSSPFSSFSSSAPAILFLYVSAPFPSRASAILPLFFVPIFSSFLPSLHYVFLLCLPSPSLFFFFFFFFFFFKSTAFSSRALAIFSSRAPVIFSSRAPAVFFFLRGSPVLSLLKELLVMYV